MPFTFATRMLAADATTRVRASICLAMVGTLLSCAAGSGCRSLSSCGRDDSISAARQLSLQGREAQQRGQWQQAESLYSAALAKCPKDDRARCGYAESLWKRGAKNDAILHMEEACRLSGGDPDRCVQLGRMYFDRGELGRADKQADAAIAANKELSQAWALKGDVYRAMGNSLDAMTSYQRALGLQSHYPEVQLALAEIHAQQKRPERALSTLQSLAASYPPGQVPVAVQHRQGLTLRTLGRHREACSCLAAAAAHPSCPPELIHDLAQTQLELGETSTARSLVNSALQVTPNHPGLIRLRDELSGDSEQMATVASRSMR